MTGDILIAQVTDFKLSDYRYRTPLYRSLQLDLDLSQSSATGEDRGLHANLDAAIDYLKVFATDKRQHISTLGAFIQPRIGNTTQTNVKSVNNMFTTGFGYGSQDRLYKEKYFIEFGGSVGGYLSSRKNGEKDKAATEGQQNWHIGLAAGIGKGRLEYVHDAQAALLLLEELYRSGIIQSPVSKETAYNLAALITNIKKQRILDARRRTIYKLTQVDSFLRASKLVTQCDARTMAIINDILFYSFQNDLSSNMNSFGREVDFSFKEENYDEGFEDTDYGLIPQLESITDQAFRQHGTIMYARLIPELRYAGFKTKLPKPAGGDTISKRTYLHVAPGIQLGYEKHNAISLKWQKNYRASLGFVYTSYISSKPNAIANYHITTLNLSYEIGYYPNSRSVIEGSGALAVSKYGGASTSTFITPEIRLDAGYFISYNTVLRASISANYAIASGEGNDSKLSQGLRVYLRHYFF